MISFLIILLISFIVFLFCLYLLARDDFILLRKNITLEEMFNYAFIAAGVGLLCGRIFYVLFHPSLQYLNPLVFLVFIYFPGLSLVGCFVSVSIYLFFLSQKNKLPRGRVFDILALSFLPAWAVNLLLSLIITWISHRHFVYIKFALGFVEFMIFLIVLLVFQKNRAKDGTISIVTIIVFSLGMLLQQVAAIGIKKELLVNAEFLTTGALFLAGVLFLVRQKNFRKRRV